MTRREKILHLIDTRQPGIEIGPFYIPIAPKRNGHNVQIIDHLSRDRLVALYGHADEIEEVDYVWDGRPYTELTGKAYYYDWIIASHVIEHVPDLIAFLENCSGILTAQGILSLAIPDKRYCFDCLRPVSGLARIIDAYSAEACHSIGTAMEYYLSVASLGGRIAWGPGVAGEVALIHPDALSLIDNFRKGPREIGAHDFHAWVFTPSSFRLLIHDLNILGLIDLHEVFFYPTEGCEFFITLGRGGTSPEFDRISMLREILKEQCECERGPSATVTAP